MKNYNHQEIEKKWQKKWEEDGIYKVSNDESEKAKYVLVEFPYPSGNLHVGHWFAFCVTDIYVKYLRMKGNKVLFPIGFDAFGLPAENAAIKKNLNPKDWTEENMRTMRDQLKSMGTSFDWDREIITCHTDYYKWTQWLFLKLNENNLVHQAETTVNWCPSCKTGLANEQVINGQCERCDTEVVQKEMNQWMIKITNYADRLIDDLEKLEEWPEAIKESQKNWIGRSEGAEFICNIKDLDIEVRMYNSVPQTFMAETFTAIAPEHPLIKKLIEGTEYEKEVLEYVEKIKEIKIKDKFSADKEKKGVFTGRYIENFCGTGKDLPIWIAPYVLYDYGTGIVNASAHDERDFEFAKENNIPLHPVMFPENEEEAEKIKNLEYAYCKDPNGIIQEPEEFKGRKWKEAREEIINYLVENNYADRKKNYKLRDWIVSRQRYWGCPIPFIHCESCGVIPVPENQLPVELPEVEDYLPNDEGRSPLSKAEDWVNTKCPKCDGDAKRETDTLDTFIDSSWYYLRYCDSKNKDTFADKNILENWIPVDFYSGGAEHTTMHVLYSRFFHKALYDLNLVPEEEPYKNRLNRGLILGPDGNKMSKSKGNVIDPDKEVENVGADTIRSYLAFLGPYNEPGNYPWDVNGIVGIRRFLERFASIEDYIDTEISKESEEKENPEFIKLLNKSIKKVSEDTSKLKFNTAISQIMILINFIIKNENIKISKKSSESIIKLMAPFAPHLAEEIWYNLGNSTSIHEERWPDYDESLIVDEEINLAIQINGKIRDEIVVNKEISEEELKEIVLDREAVNKWIEDKEKIKKFIYIKGKLVSVVV